MATYSKEILSGSTDGLGIKVSATALGSADTIHTASATAQDEIWIYAVNTNSSAVKLTICFGGVTDVDHTIEYTVPAEDGLKCIIPGLILKNSKVVKAIAGTTNVIVVYGFVNRIA